MQTRAESPTENAPRTSENLYEKDNQVSAEPPSISTSNNNSNNNRVSIHIPVNMQEYRRRLRPQSVYTQLDMGKQSRKVMVDGHQRKAFPKATIPLTVCFLEPQQSTSVDNKVSASSTPFESVADIPVFPDTASGLLLPRSGRTAGGKRGLDLVIAPEMLVS